MIVRILSIRQVAEYYNLVDVPEIWPKQQTHIFKSKSHSGEFVEDVVTTRINKWGDVWITYGHCVQFHVIVDPRGWTIMWDDESNYAILTAMPWIDYKKLQQRFETPVVGLWEHLRELFEHPAEDEQ